MRGAVPKLISILSFLGRSVAKSCRVPTSPASPLLYVQCWYQEVARGSIQRSRSRSNSSTWTPSVQSSKRENACEADDRTGRGLLRSRCWQWCSRPAAFESGTAPLAPCGWSCWGPGLGRGEAPTAVWGLARGQTPCAQRPTSCFGLPLLAETTTKWSVRRPVPNRGCPFPAACCQGLFFSTST